jgi:ribosomal protein S18 acetylase RimI-like enzyme
MTDGGRGFFPPTAALAPGVRLRQLSAGDAAAAARGLAGMDPWLTLGYAAEALTAHLQRPAPGLEKFVLEVAGSAAGVVCLRYPWLLGPYLETLGIWPEFQGRGLGRAVLSWMEDSTLGRAGNLWVAVSAFNRRARAFYQDFGFQEVGVLRDLVRPGFDELLLRKILPLPG